MKPLKDWTLQEAHNYCIGYRFSHENNCFGCKLFKQCRHPFGSFDFILPTQEETIVWHKYPDDKGFEKFTNKKLLVIDGGFITFATKDILSPHDVPGVTAWAELPEVPNWDGD